MNSKTIIDIFTLIYKGNQRVGIKVEGMEKYIYLTASNIKHNTNIEITEVEILIGSKIKPEFYKKGEIMFNGQIFKGDYPIVKDFWIECSDTIERMKENNASKLKPFRKINKAFSYNKYGKDTICFKTENNEAIFIFADRVTKLASLDLSEIHILEGSYISPEYFREGENIYEGMNREPEYCRKSNVLLKNLNLRLSGSVEEMHENFEDSEPQYTTSRQKQDYDWSDIAGTYDSEVMTAAYWNID